MKTIDELIGQLELGLYDRDVHQYHIKNVIPYLKEYKNLLKQIQERDKLIEELNQKIIQMEKEFSEILDLYV